MASEEKREHDQEQQVATTQSAVGFVGSVQERYSQLREHAETYPYVWGSYILVYGGFALWTAYRWRKLRKTENRVRALQQKLRKLVESEESGSSVAASSVDKATLPAEKPPKK